MSIFSDIEDLTKSLPYVTFFLLYQLLFILRSKMFYKLEYPMKSLSYNS